MKELLYTLLILLMFAAAPVLASDPLDHRSELEQYVDWFHCNEKWCMRPSIAKKAKELIEPTLKYCEKYNVDPLIMATIYRRESSWRNFLGDKGERGPGHVMPTKRRVKRFDLDTLDGQIEAAVWHWTKSRSTCKSLERAFTHYACGACVSSKESTRKGAMSRVRQYTEALKLFRNHQE